MFWRWLELSLQEYIDGGYSNNLPIFDDMETISISPFSGSAIIAPRDSSYFDGTVFEWKMRIGNQQLKVNFDGIATAT